MKLEYIFAFFAILAILDKIFGNRFKLGDEFEKGINTIGPLVISMAGMVVLTPLFTKGLAYVFTPVLQAFNMDKSVISSFIANDSGGAMIAYAISDDTVVRGFNGIVVASMFGATLCPVIPLALKMIKPQYHEDVLLGMLCGIATVPVGCIVSGLILGMTIPRILLNLAPIVVLSVIICFGLIKAPKLISKILGIFGNGLFVIMLAGLGLGMVDKLTGVKVIEGLEPLDNAFEIICNIAIILAGVFPLISIISRVFKKVFVKCGKALKISDVSVMGMITSLANSIPVFAAVEDMDKRGRIINMAFAVSAGFVFGDHLAFALSFDGAFAMPMVTGKLISGIAAVVLAHLVIKRMQKNMMSSSGKEEQ